MALAEIAREIELLKGVQNARNRRADTKAFPRKTLASSWTCGLQNNSHPAVHRRFGGNRLVYCQSQSGTRQVFWLRLIDRALSVTELPERGRVVPGSEVGEVP